MTINQTIIALKDNLPNLNIRRMGVGQDDADELIAVGDGFAVGLSDLALSDDVVSLYRMSSLVSVEYLTLDTIPNICTLINNLMPMNEIPKSLQSISQDLRLLTAEQKEDWIRYFMTKPLRWLRNWQKIVFAHRALLYRGGPQHLQEMCAENQYIKETIVYQAIDRKCFPNS